MKKILVADDDAGILRLLKTLMELEGNQVATVTRPEEIIPAIERERPALVLMDYHLAGGDVLETLRRMKADDALRRVPVLVTSGIDCETACREAGAESFILKPFRPAQLLERVREMSSFQND